MANRLAGLWTNANVALYRCVNDPDILPCKIRKITDVVQKTVRESVERTGASGDLAPKNAGTLVEFVLSHLWQYGKGIGPLASTLASNPLTTSLSVLVVGLVYLSQDPSMLHSVTSSATDIFNNAVSHISGTVDQASALVSSNVTQIKNAAVRSPKNGPS